MFGKLKAWLRRTPDGADVDRRIETLRRHTPVPVLWLFGKTQSGKTSIIKELTGAADAEIGEGFRPCTRTSRIYPFPTGDAPLVSFLDTRGLDEPGYDATEDVRRFDAEAHLVIVTVRLLDHATENLVRNLRIVRAARPDRPVILAVTTLHEAYPQQQHPPYPAAADEFPEPVVKSLSEHRRRFEGLVDAVVPIDLTRPEEGFTAPNYGSDALKAALLEHLPEAYRQTLLTLDAASRELRDRRESEALPYILGYSALAATAGAVPVPWVDLVVLPSIQSRMIAHLAKRAGRPVDAKRFGEVAASIGLGFLARQAIRELAKLIPYVGSVVAASLAAASTYALGQVYLYYERAVLQGHVPTAAELRDVYKDQLNVAEKLWKARGA